MSDFPRMAVRFVAAVAIMASIGVAPSSAADGIAGIDYMDPERAAEIRYLCHLRYVYDARRIEKCERKQSIAYWKFLDLQQILADIFGKLPDDDKEKLKAIFLQCRIDWSSEKFSDHVRIVDCYETKINLIIQKFGSSSDKKRGK